MAWISGHELFSIVHYHTHRPARSSSEEVAEGKVHERSLTSKVTSDRGDVNDDFIRGNADRFRETLLSLVRAFVAHPDMDNARLFIYRKDARMRLKIGLMNMLRCKSIL